MGITRRMQRRVGLSLEKDGKADWESRNEMCRFGLVFQSWQEKGEMLFSKISWGGEEGVSECQGATSRYLFVSGHVAAPLAAGPRQ
jgi:hypothetical protein